MIFVPAKLGHVFAVGSLGYAQRPFGEVDKFPFWARTKLHKQVLQKMATAYYATHWLQAHTTTWSQIVSFGCSNDINDF
jgi:hypothetical protein